MVWTCAGEGLFIYWNALEEGCWRSSVDVVMEDMKVKRCRGGGSMEGDDWLWPPLKKTS